MLCFSLPLGSMCSVLLLRAREWYAHEIYLVFCYSGMMLCSSFCSDVDDVMMRELLYKVKHP